MPTPNPAAQPRRQFLKSSAAATVAGSAALAAGRPQSQAAGQDETPARKRIGSIGTGSRWNAVGPNAMQFGDIVAVCDVDSRHLDKAANTVEKKQGTRPDRYEDYAALLARDDIDVVTIVTPDHWHTKIAIEAMRAGKDVYCEKPLTLTIEEGKQIIAALEQTGRVFQVGTQQRSEYGQRFLQAVALCHAGRLGKIQKVTCGIGGAPASDEIPAVEPPAELNWERWLGQAPLVDYRFQATDKGRPKTRCHYEFRWWYEYSGGKMTDWGAHHVDIAQWAIEQHHTGPTRVTPLQVTHPVKLDERGMPTDPSRYNTATKFQVECEFPNGVIMEIRSDGRNGVLIEGEKARLFVNRGGISGTPVDELESNPLPEDAMRDLYNGFELGGGNAHMRNFFAAIEKRVQPVSDVYSHHRAMTTCHLANIAIRLGRELRWDPEAQQIVGDERAAAMQSRPQREGYEIEV
jgi:predicted dehydrogenase